MFSNYDHTAWFYDALAKLVFGKSIVSSQTEFLHFIPAGARVLIAGGGTGWILEEIAKVHPNGLTIFYVETSEKMLNLSAKRDSRGNIVILYNQPVQEFIAAKIDVIITPFLFDNYNSEQAIAMFLHINEMLNPQGKWLNTDFQLTGKWWQRLLLKSMLLFFKLFSAVSNNRTTDMRPIFEQAGYKKVAAKTFYGDFIRTDVWRKTDNASLG